MFVAPCHRAVYVNKVFVHRYNPSADTSSWLVAVLDVGQQYNDFTADFFVFVRAIDGGNGVATLSFTHCQHFAPSLTVVTPLIANLAAVSGPAGVVLPVTVQVTNNDRYCASTVYSAALTPTAPVPTPFTCHNITVIMVPDVNPLEESYKVFDSASNVILQGDYHSSSIVYCGPPGEPLTAVFYDEGGDGYCCKYGGGSYYQLMIGQVTLKIGGQFTYTDTVPFKNQPVWNFGAVPFQAQYVLLAVVVVWVVCVPRLPLPFVVVVSGGLLSLWAFAVGL